MKRAIILTDGKPGHENQSKALAAGLGLEAVLLPCTYPCRVRKSLSLLCDRLGIRPDLTGTEAAARDLAAQGAVCLIGAGSNTFYTLKRLRQRLGLPAIAILTPRGYALSGFDAILAPAFDRPPVRENVIPLPTNLTPARPDFYEAQTAAFLERYVPAKPRAVGIIIGGKNAIADVQAPWLRAQLEALFAATPECEHWVTTSRRTSPEAEAVIREFSFDYRLLFSEDHFNPIPAFVTRCERLFVTAESTGMLSEAVAIGQSAVEVLDNLAPNAGKFRRFVDGLCAEGYAHRFDGSLGNAKRKVDLTPLFADLRSRLALN
ncbi:MAG: mitochondrial fission ELM1 family protein [Lentisphaeraceae bacterium]|nr:mitochondrial fission ELM1 family protein [Lentisphaeraceae bacterium]